MARRIFTGALLLALGYAAGTLAPHAIADDGQRLVQELKGIRSELQGIRRALEKSR